VPVATVKDDDPDVAPTGAADECSAETIVAFVAVAVTFVPAVTVATNCTTSVLSIVLSEGTGRTIAVVSAVPAVAGVLKAAGDAEAFHVVATTDMVLALAGVATIVPKVMAATMTSAIFLNEFI
jgi:hypothetical protein